jgi:hypothetical protein
VLGADHERGDFREFGQPGRDIHLGHRLELGAARRRLIGEVVSKQRTKFL